MIAVAGAALWFDGWLLRVFVAAVGIGLLWEWWNMIRRFATSHAVRALWMVWGIAYIAAACVSLLFVPPALRWVIILAVIATDSGAYFTGRHFGGPKIAPAISPSKTWSGLFGGMAGAALVVCGAWLVIFWAISALGSNKPSFTEIANSHQLALITSLAGGALLAVVAQCGDFFESWMKRRAGLKDSGSLIPGHGGLFDRVDGLLPVAIVSALFFWTKMA
jgi:phosphatidate cytidylyltransferase